MYRTSASQRDIRQNEANIDHRAQDQIRNGTLQGIARAKRLLEEQQQQQVYLEVRTLRYKVRALELEASQLRNRSPPEVAGIGKRKVRIVDPRESLHTIDWQFPAPPKQLKSKEKLGDIKAPRRGILKQTRQHLKQESRTKAILSLARNHWWFIPVLLLLLLVINDFQCSVCSKLQY